MKIDYRGSNVEILILSLVVLSGVGAWCLVSCPDKACEKVVTDVQ